MYTKTNKGVITMDTTKEQTTGDLVFKVVTKVLWFGLAIAISILIFRETTLFFTNTMEFESVFWSYVSGTLSFIGGTVFYGLYYGAFD